MLWQLKRAVGIESAPFDQRLAQALASESEQLVAVLPEEVGVGRAYLKKLDVSVNEIRQCPRDSLGVGGSLDRY